jgi:hypothetical protein
VRELHDRGVQPLQHALARGHGEVEARLRGLGPGQGERVVRAQDVVRAPGEDRGRRDGVDDLHPRVPLDQRHDVHQPGGAGEVVGDGEHGALHAPGVPFGTVQGERPGDDPLFD